MALDAALIGDREEMTTMATTTATIPKILQHLMGQQMDLTEELSTEALHTEITSVVPIGETTPETVPETVLEMAVEMAAEMVVSVEVAHVEMVVSKAFEERDYLALLRVTLPIPGTDQKVLQQEQTQQLNPTTPEFKGLPDPPDHQNVFPEIGLEMVAEMVAEMAAEMVAETLDLPTLEPLTGKGIRLVTSPDTNKGSNKV